MAINSAFPGVSESAFIGKFLDGDYRYQSFGVPGLGLEAAGPENDRVVAPYATAMEREPSGSLAEAVANFRRLAGGTEGRFGSTRPSIYTPDRLPTASAWPS